MRRVRASAGRSINLAISTRGIHALREAGLWDEMRRIIVPMKGRMMHSLAGELTFQPYGKNDTEVINSISRADLNVALMNAAEARGVTIHFGERCIGFDAATGAARFRNEETGRENRVESDTVIGTDGSASAIRMEMQKLGRFNLSQEYLDYGYKELTIPAGPGGKHLLEPNALHIWPRGAYMLIALPNIDGTFACILFLPFEGKESFAALDTAEKAAAFFAEKISRCGSVDAAAERKLLAQSDRRDGHDQMFAVARRRKGAVARRRGPRHRPFLRAGNELRVRRLHGLPGTSGSPRPRLAETLRRIRTGTESQYRRHRGSRARKFHRNARSRGGSPVSVQQEGRTRAGSQISASLCSQVRDGDVSPRAVFRGAFARKNSGSPARGIV